MKTKQKDDTLSPQQEKIVWALIQRIRELEKKK